MDNPSTAWTDRTTLDLTGLRVTLSDPVLVRRTRRFCWFPSLIRLDGGDLYACISPVGDVHVPSSPVHLARSGDGGLTWDEPRLLMDAGLSHVSLPDGSALMLPYYLRPRAGGMGASANRILPGGEVQFLTGAVTVTGWDRPSRSYAEELGLSGFVFNGQSVASTEGGWMTTLYGYFEGDSRYSLVWAESSDGFKWTIRSLIAGSDCPLEGPEGPCESAICRLADGRILCVFRNGSFVPYGQVWSADEGRTWSAPVALAAQSVEPSLQALPSGVVALSGGRPGIFIWFSAEGQGTDWQPVDVVAHHNACRPAADAIDPDSRRIDCSSEEMLRQGRGGYSSCYTELIRLDDRHLLLIYDRLGLSWQAIPDRSEATNSVWVVRIRVDKNSGGLT